MQKQLSIILILVISTATVLGQQSWTLKTCVEYAMANNISVRSSEVQSKVSTLTYQQSKLSQYPGLSFSTNGAFNAGNSQDPTTFTRVTENYLSTGMQLQSSVDIFNFFNKRNTILANHWEWMAAKATVNKIKYDIALSTANAFLQVLLAKEQEKITSVQIQQTQSQLTNTRKMVDAGSLPELNATQLEAQLASDSANFIAAKGNVVQATLALKSLMNIDAGKAFEVDAPPVSLIPVEPIADLQPEYVYSQALLNQPQQLSNEYKLKAAEKNKLAASASRYPSLTAFFNLSSSYLSFNQKPYYTQKLIGETPTPLTVYDENHVLQNNLKIYNPIYGNGDIAGYINPANFSTQVNDNLRKSIGLNLTIPIFNGGVAKTIYEKSKLAIQSVQLQKEQDNQKLKQDIYQAYNAALTALEKFNASKKALDANEKTYAFAGKRFSIGALSTFDLITSQNNLLRSKLEYSINQFDYVFKMKVLEFYKGVGLKL